MSGGTYLVATASDSRYIIDLERMTLCRVAATATVIESSMLQDGTEIVFLWLGKLEVGSTLPMILDLQVPGLRDTFRRTTPIVSVEYLRGRDEEVEQ